MATAEAQQPSTATASTATAHPQHSHGTDTAQSQSQHSHSTATAQSQPWHSHSTATAQPQHSHSTATAQPHHSHSTKPKPRMRVPCPAPHGARTPEGVHCMGTPSRQIGSQAPIRSDRKHQSASDNAVFIPEGHSEGQSDHRAGARGGGGAKLWGWMLREVVCQNQARVKNETTVRVRWVEPERDSDSSRPSPRPFASRAGDGVTPDVAPGGPEASDGLLDFFLDSTWAGCVWACGCMCVWGG